MPRIFAIAAAAMMSAMPAVSIAGPYDGAAVSKAERAQSRPTRDTIQRVCKVSYDADTTQGGPREVLSSAQCPVNSPMNKGDACFCVVMVDGQPYAAAGKVAFLLPGGGYSW